MKEYKFEALIIKTEKVDSGFIEFPYDVLAEFGKKGQVKVKAYFDGYEYRGSLVKMGHHCHIVGLNKEVRTAINKNVGDTVNVVIFEDKDERTVEIPADLNHAFNENPEARTTFEKLSFTHRKEYVVWITSAKKQETRDSRVLKCIQMLFKAKK